MGIGFPSLAKEGQGVVRPNRQIVSLTEPPLTPPLPRRGIRRLITIDAQPLNRLTVLVAICIYDALAANSETAPAALAEEGAVSSSSMDGDRSRPVRGDHQHHGKRHCISQRNLPRLCRPTHYSHRF